MFCGNCTTANQLLPLVFFFCWQTMITSSFPPLNASQFSLHLHVSPFASSWMCSIPSHFPYSLRFNTYTYLSVRNDHQHHSYWSGSVAPFPGWRIEIQRTPCRQCSKSWRTLEITVASTSHPKCRKSASWRSTSTPCRPSWDSATGLPSCRLRGRWSW